MDLGISITIAVALIAIIVNLVLYFRSKRTKEPIWYYKTEEVISTAEKLKDDIQIYFKGQKVSQVSVSKIGLVNVGKEPIDQAHVKRPIKLPFNDNISILQEPKVLKCTRDEIDFKVTHSGTDVFLSFSLLDHLDGAVTEVVHTGDKNTNLQIEGTILGVPKGIISRSYRYASSRLKKYHLFVGLINSALLIYISCQLIPANFNDIVQGLGSPLAISLSALMILGLLLSVIQHVIDYRKSIPSCLSIED